MACACGPSGGATIARGTDMQGVPWRIKAKLIGGALRGRHSVQLEFSSGRWGRRTEEGHSAYFTVLTYPLHPAFVFTATEGFSSDEPPERSISGVARGRVATLVAELADGTSLSFAPSRAPGPTLRGRPWLRNLRVFYVHFPPEAAPRALSAYDAAGHRLDRREYRRGAFR